MACRKCGSPERISNGNGYTTCAPCKRKSRRAADLRYIRTEKGKESHRRSADKDYYRQRPFGSFRRFMERGGNT